MASVGKSATDDDFLLLVEKRIEVCFQMANMDNPEAIRVGAAQHHRHSLLVDFNVHAGHSRAIGVQEDEFPGRVRVYLDPVPCDDFEIVEGSLDYPLMPDADFIRRRAGVIVKWKRLRLRIHACTNGGNLHYDSANFPFSVYNHTFGESRTVQPLVTAVPLVLDVKKAAAEVYILAALAWAKGNDPQAITLGLGGVEKKALFADFIIIDPTAVPEHRFGIRGQGHIPRAYRIYLNAPKYIIDQIPMSLLLAKEADDRFVSKYPGLISDTTFIGVSVHVCPVGVQIRFRQSSAPGGIHIHNLGQSFARENFLGKK